MAESGRSTGHSEQVGEVGSSIPTRRRLVAAGGLGIGAVLAMGSSAQAATITVTNLNDLGTGSLRDAITSANANPDVDTITFASGLSGTITLASQLPTITHPVDIEGPGAAALTVSGAGANKIFYSSVASNGDPVTIAGLSLVDANFPAGLGGAITNANAALTVKNATISGNSADGAAGISSFEPGSLSVINSTISGNHAAHYEGGIFARGEVTIQSSTISGNTAERGEGGLFISYPSSSAVIANSTIANNTENYGGAGGIGRGGASGELRIVDSTISGNHANSSPSSSARGGGGIYVYSGTVKLEDTIVAGNTTSSAGTASDIKGPLGAAFSLIGNPSGATITDNVPGSTITGADPQLGALQNNGGPTQTMLPAATSPVIDKGSAFGLSSDQRGVLRPIDFPSIPNSSASGADGSDVGAVELQPANALTLGALRRNKKKGTAVQTVKLPIPDAGSVALTGKFLKTQTQQVADNGVVKLKVVPKSKLRRLLKRKGKARTTESVTYNPSGQSPNSIARKIKLLKKKRRHH